MWPTALATLTLAVGAAVGGLMNNGVIDTLLQSERH